jgi:thioredoxin reductase (NADPH)
MQERAKANPKISFIFDSEVVDVLGEKTVSAVKIRNNKMNKEIELVAQGLFVAIGHKPNTDFLKGKIELDRGYIKVIDNTKTSVEGIFAGGDVHDYRYRQAVTAAGLGCMAALDAEKYLEEKK